jgi:hypothetical protein
MGVNRMNKQEAKSILTAELSLFRAKSYEELTQLVGAEASFSQIPTETGHWYQIEIQAVWNSKPNGDIRVSGRIDNGGWRAFFPLTNSFIKTPQGAFVEKQMQAVRPR